MSSNSSNSSNSSSADNAGGGSNSTSVADGWFFADRIDLPFVTEVTGAGVAVANEQLAWPAFPERNWSADWFAWRVLVDFTQTKWATTITLLDWTKMSNFTTVAAEIANLVTAAQDERADALGEILSQADEFTSYFLNLMTAKPTSYPATTRVLNAAALVGLFVVMNWKAKFNRPRPSQLCPALLPPIAVPGHAAYPSGHSTQAHLMALCMGQVFALLPAAQQPLMQPMQADLWVLADRIARNREIAGLHYPSDTAAGIVLANQIIPLLNGLDAGSAYPVALGNAAKEWTWP